MVDRIISSPYYDHTKIPCEYITLHSKKKILAVERNMVSDNLILKEIL